MFTAKAIFFSEYFQSTVAWTLECRTQIFKGLTAQLFPELKVTSLQTERANSGPNNEIIVTHQWQETKDNKKILKASRERKTGYIHWKQCLQNCESVIWQPRNIFSAKLLSVRLEIKTLLIVKKKNITSHIPFLKELPENMLQDLTRDKENWSPGRRWSYCANILAWSGYALRLNLSSKKLNMRVPEQPNP